MVTDVKKANDNYDKTANIQPYTIHITDERLKAIRTRVEGYDWSQLPDTGGWRSGVGVHDLRRLVDYWLNQYDWRRAEQQLNELPHFILVPTAVANFPDPCFIPPPRSFSEKTYHVTHFTEMNKGGHFAALEQPELMLADLRSFIAGLNAH